LGTAWATIKALASRFGIKLASAVTTTAIAGVAGSLAVNGAIAYGLDKDLKQHADKTLDDILLSIKKKKGDKATKQDYEDMMDATMLRNPTNKRDYIKKHFQNSEGLPEDIKKIAREHFKESQYYESKASTKSQEPPPQVQSKAKEDAVSQPSAENKQLSDSRNKNTTTVVNVPAKQQAPNVIQSNKDSGGGIIIIRNTEPSVATYVASIFDHPVVHPGIYKM